MAYLSFLVPLLFALTVGICWGGNEVILQEFEQFAGKKIFYFLALLFWSLINICMWRQWFSASMSLLQKHFPKRFWKRPKYHIPHITLILEIKCSIRWPPVFKQKLNEFLSTIPDEPLCHGYHRHSVSWIQQLDTLWCYHHPDNNVVHTFLFIVNSVG